MRSRNCYVSLLFYFNRQLALLYRFAWCGMKAKVVPDSVGTDAQMANH